MSKITIRYSHDSLYPWRIFDITKQTIYHSKYIDMVGNFKGSTKNSGAEIETSGYYEASEIIFKNESKELDKMFGISEVFEINTIKIYGQ